MTTRGRPTKASRAAKDAIEARMMNKLVDKLTERVKLEERARGTRVHENFVTISFFVKEMLGLRDRGWYYAHKDDPGMPKRVRMGGKVLLPFADCVAYVNQLKKKAEPEPLKRGRGRPRKQVAA